MVGFPPFFLLININIRSLKLIMDINFDDNLQAIKQMNKELNIKTHIVKL